MPIIIHPGKCDQADECDCPQVCAQGAWCRDETGEKWTVDNDKCIDCGVCVHYCPADAVILALSEDEKEKILKEIEADTTHTPETLFVERYGGFPLTEEIVIDSKSFDSKVPEGVTLVEFYNEDSIKCLVKSPPYHEFASDMTMYKVDADKSKDLKDKYEVELFPSLLVFKDGKEMGRIENFIGKIDIIKKRLNKIL